MILIDGFVNRPQPPAPSALPITVAAEEENA
jgi:hypothetical protein